jgi:hypothetical protein
MIFVRPFCNDFLPLPLRRRSWSLHMDVHGLILSLRAASFSFCYEQDVGVEGR